METQTTLKDQISNNIKRRFIELTDSKTFDTELSFALQHIERNPQLKKATVESNILAVLNIAQTGLTLNPVLKHAYLVPRTRKVGEQWIVETCLEPSYQGLCKLVTDTGSAKRIYAQLVYEGDDFEVSFGTANAITHRPKFKTKIVTHVYMVAVLSDNSNMIEVMTAEEINDIRGRSESYKAFEAKKLKSCVWVTDFGEMARKTVIRRGIKYLPKTEMWDRVGEAVNLDESDYRATDDQINYIESLLMTAVISPEEQSNIFRELTTMSADRAREVIDRLRENQLDPIASGTNYDQGDIARKLKKEIQ